jgi:hypothetical protein
MVQGGGGPGLALEAFNGGAVARELVRQDLDGDAPSESDVLGEIDDAHAAAANLFEDSIM